MDLFRKPKKRNGTAVAVRQRASSDEDDTTKVEDVVRKRRRNNPMVQSTKKDKDNHESSTDSDSDYNERVAAAEHSFAASGETGPSGPRDQGATATLNIDTDFAADAQAQFERVQKQLKEGLEKDGKTLYKGSAMYGAKEAKDTAKGNASSGMNRVGPVRAPQFLRQTVRWDFAPDICKDYKETGYCTFGDSCKFVHDRSDYKHGWEIDEEYEQGKYGKEDDTNYEINEEDEVFPDECFVCGNVFVDPIVTKCKHYFCGDCALKSFRSSAKCPICHQNTDKIMNAAKDLIQYLKRKKAAVQEKESSSDSDDDEPSHSGCADHDHDHNREKTEGQEEYGSDDNFEDASHYHDQTGGDDEEGQEENKDEELEIEMEDVEGLDGGENEEDDEDSGSETSN